MSRVSYSGVFFPLKLHVTEGQKRAMRRSAGLVLQVAGLTVTKVIPRVMFRIVPLALGWITLSYIVIAVAVHHSSFGQKPINVGNDAVPLHVRRSELFQRSSVHLLNHFTRPEAPSLKTRKMGAVELAKRSAVYKMSAKQLESVPLLTILPDAVRTGIQDAVWSFHAQ